MSESSLNKQEFDAIWADPVFTDLFLPMYLNYKSLDRDFDKKVIDKDLETIRKKFVTIALAKERRKKKPTA